MLDFIVTFRIIIIILIHLLTLLIIKLINGLESLHGPVSKLPRFAPANVHWFCANNHNNKFNAFVTDACCQARSRRRCDTSFNSIDASLAQHQVSVVPLISLPVAIRVLLQNVRLRSHCLPKQRDLHSLSTKSRNIQCWWLVLWISQTMWRIIKWPFQIKFFSCFIHLLQEIQYLRVVLELTRLGNPLALLNGREFFLQYLFNVYFWKIIILVLFFILFETSLTLFRLLVSILISTALITLSTACLSWKLIIILFEQLVRLRAGQLLTFGILFLYFLFLLLSLNWHTESLAQLNLEFFIFLRLLQVLLKLLFSFLTILLKQVPKVLSQLVCCIVSTGQHKSIEQLSYSEGVTLH